MINREVWEESLKDVRQEMLDKVHDPDFRRMTAVVVDAFSDLLFDKLNQKLVMILEKKLYVHCQQSRSGNEKGKSG